ncbi:MAG: hypothetical protein NZ992_02220 [Candidatus Korarchaeum sp.]|nr:hypothetical protein [Candidatus Korarchaeum sp.]MDW8036180.1 hypothetical protein [Candidatus Korarchaeum sp.]
MKSQKILALALALLSILLSVFYTYRMSERASIKELKITWPKLDEISAR